MPIETIPTRDWLAAHFRTVFRPRPDGRIERENDRDGSAGPRLWLAAGTDATLLGLRADLPTDVAARLEALAASEPPLVHPAIPRHTDRYRAMLDVSGPVEPRHLGLIYPLPHGLARPADVGLVGSDDKEGLALARSLAGNGMPEGLRALGFASPADFWAPWCVALADGEIAAVAFAARLSDAGAGLGIATAAAFRGRGFAAAATAAWTQLPSLRSRVLFYSTDRGNIASQRVAAKLGLRLRATSLRIP